MRLYKDNQGNIFTDGRAFDRLLKSQVYRELRYGTKYDLESIELCLEEARAGAIMDVLNEFTIYTLQSDGYFLKDTIIEWDYDYIISLKEVYDLLKEKQDEWDEFNKWAEEIEQEFWKDLKEY